MKILVVLAAIFSFGLAEPATLLTGSQLTDELIKDPKYLVFEREDGFFEVEDLETSALNTTVFAGENDVTFKVYTPENHSGTLIRASQVRSIVSLTGFNRNRNTVVIIHGWRNHFLSPVNAQIRRALLVSRLVNVIVVDWSGIADMNYVSAQSRVTAVGNFIGDFLIRLNNEVGYAISRITLVGHSLGAHISGNAGARTRGLVDTIIGLDPAGPLFSANNINNRLDPTDGNFVHVIHTNDGLLGFGIRMGDADYYPNGGATQPGCGIDLTGSCAHSRAYYYYAESINNNRFVSRQCSSYSNFLNNSCNRNIASLQGNWPVARTVNGQYFLLTNSASLFARG